MPENFSNTYQTTLNDSGGISSGDLTLIVTSATGAPAPNFRIKIDTEYLLVTGVASTTFTVTRGIEGSTPASHADGATVTHVLTAGGLAQTLADSVWSQMDKPPTGPHASDVEMDAPLPGAWTWVASSGSPTDQTLGEWVDAGTQTVPSYNVNNDVPGALVMRPANGAKLLVTRTFAPTTATDWVVAAKFRLSNTSGTDDRMRLIVSNAAISDTSPADAATAEFRNNTGNYSWRGIKTNNTTPTVLESSVGVALSTAYVALVGFANNTIVIYYSVDGIAWVRNLAITTGDILGAVSHVAASIEDTNNNATMGPCIGIVDWIRFLEGSNNLWDMGAGN